MTGLGLESAGDRIGSEKGRSEVDTRLDLAGEDLRASDVVARNGTQAGH
jgi:hypothetical protein